MYLTTYFIQARKKKSNHNSQERILPIGEKVREADFITIEMPVEFMFLTNKKRGISKPGIMLTKISYKRIRRHNKKGLVHFAHNKSFL